MVFEWDEHKRESNLTKHKLDLADGMELFDGRPTISYPSTRDEPRWITIGLIGTRTVAVVWTRRTDATRLISLRRARDAEKRAYHARHG